MIARKPAEKWQFWIDRGGTFTDIIAKTPDGKLLTRKYLSDNPQKYADASLYGIAQILGADQNDPVLPDQIGSIRMGTTIATNALLEKKGQPTVLAVTKGFADVIEIGYQARSDTFALNIVKPELLHDDVVEIHERIRADGTVETPPDIDRAIHDLHDAYRKGFRSLAIALMHAYAFPDHEKRLARVAKKIGFTQISVSHDVSPLIRIIPRAETCVVDAYLTPVLNRHIKRLGDATHAQADKLLFMQSSGGLIDASNFRGHNAVMSGPAGGFVACIHTARQAGFNHVIGFDMGGTSTDVSHYAGTFEKTYETTLAGVRLRTPMIHVHSIAAGGGSILAYQDGRFRVGPNSAGADPGPVCYRRGGPLTVTDINAALGKLHPDFFPHIFGPNQNLPLDINASYSAFADIAAKLANGWSPEQVAQGFLDIAVEHMARAIRKMSVSRGYDITGYVMNCFGGAGGQHACLVAQRLGIGKIMLHPLAGVLSAFGMGLANIRTERQHMINRVLEHGLIDQINSVIHTLKRRNASDLANQGVATASMRHTVSALLRYQGTDTTIEIEVNQAKRMRTLFEERHKHQFGFVTTNADIVVDTVIVQTDDDQTTHVETTQTASPDHGPPEPVAHTRMYSQDAWRKSPVYHIDNIKPGHQIIGPAIISESNGTIVVESGWIGQMNAHGHLILDRSETGHGSAAPDTCCNPVTLEIFNSMFMAIAEQMGVVLRNTSRSVNVRERLDFSCAIFDPRGNLVANAPHVPVHLGSMDSSVKAIVSSGLTIAPGDAFVANDPYSGGSHLPDITVTSPVFDSGGESVLFYVASRAHHEDIGGIAPGSMSPLAKTIHEEGVVLNNLKLIENGVLMTRRIRQALSRKPFPARNIDQNIADLSAQAAANANGINELQKMIQCYGLETVHAYMGHIQDSAEKAITNVVSSLKTGSFRLERDSGTVIQVAVTPNPVSGIARIDFTGTSAQEPTNFNAPKAITHAAILYVFRCLADDDIPLNAGCLRPLDIVIPDGSILNPRYPAAVVAGNVETSQAITDALFAAMDRLGSAQGTMNNLSFGNARYQYYETICSGAPAGPGFHGASAVHTHMTNTRLTDPEILEQRYPVMLDTFKIDRHSGGHGKWNAGDGTTRTIRFLDHMQCSILSENRQTTPAGLHDGQPGRRGSNRIERSSGTIENIGGCAQVTVKPGDRITIRTPTGGGYGRCDTPRCSHPSCTKEAKEAGSTTDTTTPQRSSPKMTYPD